MRTRRVPLALLLLLALSACRTTTDTSQLTDQGLRDLKALRVTKIVNDASAVVIAANHAGKIPDAVELQILSINKQVLDVIQEHPVTFEAHALAVAKNAREAMPPNVRAVADEYLGTVFDILGLVR